MTIQIPETAARTQTLAIFGATGGVGRAVVARALSDGHRVIALVRDPARLAACDGLTVLQVDACDAAAVHRAVEGADAVLCCLGAPALSRSTVRSEGTRNIVTAMAATGVTRLVCVSVLGAAESHDILPFFLRYLFFPLYLRRAVADHEAQERIIAESDVDWTVVRPPHLTDGPGRGHYTHGFGNDAADLSMTISRADVADFMLRQLSSPQYSRAAAGISDRKPGA